MKTQKTEIDFFNYLKNKRVAIVGPAGYLKGQGKGEEIDSHDIVIRVNHALPILFPKDYGKRTDVLYSILFRREVSQTGNRSLEITEDIKKWKENDITWIIPANQKEQSNKKRIHHIDGTWKWCKISETTKQELNKKINKTPNTGLLAIYHLLKSDLKSLNIYGFDFYKSEVYEGYGDIRNKITAFEANFSKHDLNSQVSFLRILVQSDNRLRIEKELREILLPDDPSLKIENEFFDYLKDKKVIIVGPASYLKGLNKGAEIDSYDVIIRMNLGACIPEELKKDYGSRTDVLYHTILYDKFFKIDSNLFQPHSEKEVQSWKDFGVNWVITRNSVQTPRVKPFVNLVKKIIPCFSFPEYQEKMSRNQIKTAANMATLIIFHILQSQLKSLDIIGCDFHQTGYFVGYGGFNEEQAAKGANSTNCWGQHPTSKEDVHKIKPQLNYLFEKLLEDERFKVDDVLLNILKKEVGIVAIIPMKEHSERVPGKNLRDLAGKPLFFWIIETLNKSEFIKKVVVDTDSDLIAEKVLSYFPNTQIIKRPDHLKGDLITGNSLFAHDLTILKEDLFLQTHSTNPLLTVETINKAIKLYFKNLKEGYDSLYTVTKYHTRLFRKNGTPVNHDPKVLIRTQDLEPLYEDNSNIYIFSRNPFKRYGRIGKKPYMMEMSKLEAVDIDTEEDFKLAEILKQYELKQRSV